MLSAAKDETKHLTALPDQTCRRFSLDEIKSSTHDFDESFVIGRGGFGNVYKAQMNGSANCFAIKRLNSMSNQGAPQFLAEVETLSKLRHCNLVSLIGYCDEEKEMILVYDYMPHGTLEDHLHRGVDADLSWLQRLKICIGAARGLDYLHTGTGTQHGIIHRDVKTSNILLDENFAAKISDFGLAKVGPTNQPRTYVSTAVKGTFGYMDPCDFYTGKLTRKSDVYSFGVVLLEVICGRPAVDTSLDEAQWGLAPWAQDKIKQGKLKQIVDHRLIRGQASSKCLKDFARIASDCLHNQPDQRPTMDDVVFRLDRIRSLQERLDLSATEGKFMDKVVSFFSSKVESKTNNGGEESNEEGRDTSNRIRASAGSLTEGSLKQFSYQVLQDATRGFNRDNILEELTSGIVFKGWIDELTLDSAKPGFGSLVAIKRLNIYFRVLQEWFTEITYIAQLNHPNIVKLIGYCVEDIGRVLLVYEFMPKGCLTEHLFRRNSVIEPFPWNHRVKVLLDAAKGLAYLHRKEPEGMFYRLSIENIFMDSNFNAKLLDVGLKINGVFLLSPQDKSEPDRYTDPGLSIEYSEGLMTASSHIYSLGVILLELFTGMRYHRPHFANKGSIFEIMDSSIHGQCSTSVAKRVVKLALKCISSNSNIRPTADDIVKELEDIQTNKEHQ